MANAVIEGKKIAAEGGDISEFEVTKKDKIEQVIEIEKEELKEDAEVTEEVVEEVEKKKEEKSKKEENKPKKIKKEPEKIKEEKKETRFECPDCGKTFSSKRGLKIHLGLVHQK